MKSGDHGFLSAFRRLVALSSVVFLVLLLLQFLQLQSPAGKPPNAPKALPASSAGGPLPSPIVMVVVDEFPVVSMLNRNGRVDANLYPNLDEISRSFTWYRNTTTVDNVTIRSIPSMLDGRYSQMNRKPVFEDHSKNLFMLLDPDYDVFGEEHMMDICPSDVCRPIGFTADTVWDAIPRVMADWREFLATLGSGTAPDFYYQHLVLPHLPWRYLPSGKRYASHERELTGIVRDEGRRRWTYNRGLVTQGRQRHLLQAGAVDRMLGRLVDRLKALGTYDSSLIVIVSDHGISFKPGLPGRFVSRETLADVAPIPLFIKFPNQVTGRTSDRPAQTIDLLPTIADVAGAPTWRGVDGTSLLNPPPPGPVRRTILTRDGRRTFGRIWNRIDAAASRKYAIFGRRGARIDLFRLGPGRTRSMVGKRLARFPRARSRGIRAEVAKLSSYRNVDLRQRTVPILIRGRLIARRATGWPRVVAVALNGRVAGVTKTFGHRQRSAAFYSVVSPSRLVSGRNVLGVFLIERDAGGRRVLRRVALRSS